MPHGSLGGWNTDSPVGRHRCTPAASNAEGHKPTTPTTTSSSTPPLKVARSTRTSARAHPTPGRATALVWHGSGARGECQRLLRPAGGLAGSPENGGQRCAAIGTSWTLAHDQLVTCPGDQSLRRIASTIYISGGVQCRPCGRDHSPGGTSCSLPTTSNPRLRCSGYQPESPYALDRERFQAETRLVSHGLSPPRSASTGAQPLTRRRGPSPGHPGKSGVWGFVAGGGR